MGVVRESPAAAAHPAAAARYSASARFQVLCNAHTTAAFVYVKCCAACPALALRSPGPGQAVTASSCTIFTAVCCAASAMAGTACSPRQSTDSQLRPPPAPPHLSMWCSSSRSARQVSPNTAQYLSSASRAASASSPAAAALRPGGGGRLGASTAL
jgi:hypothetical protein